MISSIAKGNNTKNEIFTADEKIFILIKWYGHADPDSRVAALLKINLKDWSHTVL